MANRTRAQAARERTRPRELTPQQKANEMAFLREKRARQILLEIKEVRAREAALSDELWDLMQIERSAEVAGDKVA